MARLGDICRVVIDGDWIESKDQSETGLRLIQTGNIGIGEYLDKSSRAKFISEETFERLNCTEVFPGDILISRLPDPIGRACIIPQCIGKAITAVDCTIVRLDDSLCDDNYFINYTQSVKYTNELSKFLAGTTRTRISRKNLEKIEIPLPSLEEQKKIAAVLDKVSDLIAKRRQQLDKLDLLVKARFVEMFGDIDKLNVNWHSEHFKDITVCFDSFRKPVKASDRKLMQGKYPYYGATGIVDYVNDYKLDGEYLLISEDGKSLEFRNKPIAFIAKGKIWVNNHAHVVQCKEKANITYLMFHINYMDISRWVTGIDQKKLNKENLDSIFIAIPPIELQNEFADFVEQTEKTKTSIKESLEKLETLKRALMQEYFG